MADAPGASNVLFVVLDTVRKDHLTPYGYGEPTTPTLDAFAEEARVYDQAVAQAPWTLPVHASMFTGRYPSDHGATQESPYLEGATTLAESVSAAGYETACYSSNAWITPYTNLTAGFDRRDNFFRIMPADVLSGPLARAWRALNDSDRLRGIADRLVQVGNRFHEHFAADEGGDTKTPAVVDATIDFADGAEPFFAFVNLMDAHMPYHPPAEHAEAFAPGVDTDAVCQNAKEFNAGARRIDEEEWAAIRGLYDAEIRHVDAELERLFAHLKATGRWEDTTVVVCADHGECHGEGGLYGHEFGVYDPLVNVPLLVKAPGLEPGRDGGTVELLDLYHTVLDATGAEGRGVALDPARSLLREEYRAFDETVGGLDRRDLAFVEYHRPVVELRQLESRAAAAGVDVPTDSRFYSRMAAARRPDAKYVHTTRIADEGYRLDGDPCERDDVGGQDELVADLGAALAAFGEAVGAAWLTGTWAAGVDAAGAHTAREDAPARPVAGPRSAGPAAEGTDRPVVADGEGAVLGEMDADARQRLRELGYLE